MVGVSCKSRGFRHLLLKQTSSPGLPRPSLEEQRLCGRRGRGGVSIAPQKAAKKGKEQRSHHRILHNPRERQSGSHP